MQDSSPKITTFFMFSGQAEEAMQFYTSVFEPSNIVSVFYQEDGSVLHAVFALKGQTFMAIDQNHQDKHPFTPALSLFVTCDSEEEIHRVFDQLSQEGQVLMSLEASPVSQLFGWVQDKYGVSWQLNLAKGQPTMS
ncbi:glyoxalase family protein [Paenibacillus sp. IHB B 3084]|uniref:VOC family protein n=1 Tax=Paenibacillus TaxID=44249 RepID=UPI000722A2D1|nr:MULTISPECIES: VOC family protein [Paenibacillus]ALP36660.1 glyoxalase family protein [Paenibacillus sp. IHB B 3084]MBE0339008.1 VOC family protein [Paenibacillus sp. 23TSA30-6]